LPRKGGQHRPDRLQPTALPGGQQQASQSDDGNSQAPGNLSPSALIDQQEATSHLPSEHDGR
jgi:hypothetical protein